MRNTKKRFAVFAPEIEKKIEDAGYTPQDVLTAKRAIEGRTGQKIRALDALMVMQSVATVMTAMPGPVPATIL